MNLHDCLSFFRKKISKLAACNIKCRLCQMAW
jgi:hypothetical protein